MVNITINGQSCRAEENRTILQAARENGITIPDFVLSGRHQ